jgi:glycine/D-amino acid oxidase-like deaminating enzyme
LNTDAVVIGAGVIGGAIAFELARGGRDVVIVDKGGAPGHGSTSSSSAIVRFNYSTVDGVATSWEAKHCWERWPSHLGGLEGPLARFHRTGMIVLDTPQIPRARAAALLARVGVPYEEWGPDTLRARVAGLDAGAHWPPKAIEDDAFFEDPPRDLGALFMPASSTTPSWRPRTSSAPRRVGERRSCSTGPSPRSCVEAGAPRGCA